MQCDEMKWLQRLLEKFPSFNPNWTSGVTEKWWETFRELMERGCSVEQLEKKVEDFLSSGPFCPACERSFSELAKLGPEIETVAEKSEQS